MVVGLMEICETFDPSAFRATVPLATCKVTSPVCDEAVPFSFARISVTLPLILAVKPTDISAMVPPGALFVGGDAGVGVDVGTGDGAGTDAGVVDGVVVGIGLGVNI